MKSFQSANSQQPYIFFISSSGRKIDICCVDITPDVDVRTIYDISQYVDPLFFVLSNHEVLHTFQDHLIRLVCLSISLNPFFVEGFNFQFLLSHTTNSCGLPHLIVIGCFLLRCFETQPGNFSSNKDCFHLRTLLSIPPTDRPTGYDQDSVPGDQRYDPRRSRIIFSLKVPRLDRTLIYSRCAHPATTITLRQTMTMMTTVTATTVNSS